MTTINGKSMSGMRSGEATTEFLRFVGQFPRFVLAVMAATPAGFVAIFVIGLRIGAKDTDIDARLSGLERDMREVKTTLARLSDAETKRQGAEEERRNHSPHRTISPIAYEPWEITAQMLGLEDMNDESLPTNPTP
jgi:hypothetical protein